MLSISKTESGIVEFLVRRFSESFTIRKLAENIKVSPAGAHKSIKHLEEQGIIVTERIGAALVCKVNLENPVAEHFAAMMLAEPNQNKKPAFAKELKAASAIVSGSKILVISDFPTDAPEGAIILSESDLLLKLLKKDSEIIEFIRAGTILFGESVIIKAIKDRGSP